MSSQNQPIAPDSQPLVSVIMNCYNGARYLREAIDSVISQTYPNWELVFWDNQSTDESAEICQSYQDSRIRYLKAPEHTDYAPARALAIQHVKGELVAVLDTDDLWLPQKLELQAPLFAKPEIGIVISDTIFFNSEGDERQLYKSGPPPQGKVFHELATRYFVSLETVLLRKSAIDSLHQSFDPAMGHICDFDLITRLGYQWELAYVPQVLGKYRVHPNSLTWTQPEKINSGKLLFAKKMDYLYPASDSDWQKAKKGFMRGIAISNATASFLEGRKAECRKHLSGFVMDEWRIALLFLGSFFPLSEYLVLAYVRMRTLGYKGT